MTAMAGEGYLCSTIFSNTRSITSTGSHAHAGTVHMQRALLRTAQEIAKGMDYIHSFGIIHGDLKLGNVLLKTHRVDRRGYVAKVSDFGTRLSAAQLLLKHIRKTDCIATRQSHDVTSNSQQMLSSRCISPS